MPVELRKRKAVAAPPTPRPAKRKASKVAKTAAAKDTAKEEAAKEEPSKEEAAKDATKELVSRDKNPSTNGSSASNTVKIAVGNTIKLEGFGGEVQMHDGEKTTLKALLEESTSGVVIFTYPKASTPGCTKQACLFRDAYKSLTSTGLSIYGLSTDSPTANTTFKTKQKLPYSLLCDPSATLIKAIGLKKSPKGAVRGVFAVDKDGKILAAEAGGPAATVEVIEKLIPAGDKPFDSDAKKDDDAEKLDEKEGEAVAEALDTK